MKKEIQKKRTIKQTNGGERGERMYICRYTTAFFQWTR